MVLTNDGKNLLLSRNYSDSAKTKPTSFCVGNDDTAAGATDTYLVKPIPKSAEIIDACNAITDWTESADGDAVAVNSTAGEYKYGSGCLNLPATDNTGTATWTKTIGGLDLTGKYFYVWFYVVDKATHITNAAAAVRLRLGTGGVVNAGNYDVAYADIDDGWNLLVFDVSDATSDEGTGVDITDVDTIQISVKIEANAVGNNMRMDYWHYADLSEHNIPITASYPTFDTANKRVTLRGVLASTEGNGYILNEVGLKNADTPFIFVGRDVLGASVTKNNKTRVVITWVDRVV